MDEKRVVIGSDKSGFHLKEAVKAHLIESGYEVEDAGTLKEEEPKPYFKVAPVVAEKIQSGEFQRGILICGTGMGMAVVANKYKGVYAAVCESTYAANKCRAINDANVLTMGGWMIGPELGCDMADQFLNTGFTQNLEPWRQEFLKGAREQVYDLEKEIYDKAEK
ncbi:RpiB/LacA/LacB family sugar-phosphate isomerase [Clostridium sp. AM58-1XD]|nr:RpiB/LacA/LacB family sugar-phosphate isomerase [Clostridium sp. AM58-1XD]